MDLKRIENLILEGKYEIAADQLFELINKYRSLQDKEMVYNSLSIMNLICDKSPKISLKILNNISTFVNEEDSWIRLVALEILYQITIYRPNLLLELLDDIKLRLYDNDAPVRRLAVKIIGALINSLYLNSDDLSDILNEFMQKLMDNDWKVKLLVLNTIQEIISRDFSKIKNIEPLLSMVIVNLRDKDDDVARSSAELLKMIGTLFISKEKLFYILLSLLHNEKVRVKELIIWLFGEIGKEKSSEIIPFIPKIINLLKDKNYRIQIKVIDALNNIALNNFDQIWANLIHSISESGDFSYRNSMGNAIYFISQNNIHKIFPILFEELEHPSKNVRETIALVFKRLYDDFQVELENEITRILYKLESKYWRERKKTVQLLKNICLILKSQKIAVWITIELKKTLESEKDLEVVDEINYSLDKIKFQFPKINITIQNIKEELQFLKNKIRDFQKIPANFRRKLNSNIKNFKFNETEIKLNQMYDDILRKIHKFHDKINSFEYKRLAYNLIEEWEETKIQVIDELSIIKSFISDICNEKKEEYKTKLQSKINILMDRVEILKAQFDYMKTHTIEDNYIEDIDTEWYSEPTIQDKFNYFSIIRSNLFRLDVDIREILINNVEFDEIFKDLLSKWVAVKVEIQIYLNNLDRKIKTMKQKLVKDLSMIHAPQGVSQYEDLDELSEELTFQILQGHIQSIISHGIEGIKKFNNNFTNLELKLNNLILRKGFEEAKRLINMNSSQIHSFLSETEKQLDNIINQDGFVKNNKEGYDLYIKPSLKKWRNSKELLLNKLDKYIARSKEKLHLHQIKNYLRIMTPIDLKLLSEYIGLDTEFLKKMILKFINKGKLDAKIVDGTIYSPKIKSDLLDFKEINLFKHLKTIGNHLEINLRLNNPSNYDFENIQITLKIPSYLDIIKEKSFPKFFNIKKLKSGDNFKFKYVLKMDKQIKNSLFDKTPDEINLIIYYETPFGISKSFSKKIDILLS